MPDEGRPQLVTSPTDQRHRVYDGTKIAAIYEPHELGKAEAHLAKLLKKGGGRKKAPAMPTEEELQKILSAPAPVVPRTPRKKSAPAPMSLGRQEDTSVLHIKEFSDGYRIWHPTERRYIGPNRGAFQDLPAASERLAELRLEMLEKGLSLSAKDRKRATADAALRSVGTLFAPPTPSPTQRAAAAQGGLWGGAEREVASSAVPSGAPRRAEAPKGQGTLFNGARPVSNPPARFYVFAHREDAAKPWGVFDGHERYILDTFSTRALADRTAEQANRALETARANRTPLPYAYLPNGEAPPFRRTFGIISSGVGRVAQYEADDEAHAMRQYIDAETQGGTYHPPGFRPDHYRAVAVHPEEEVRIEEWRQENRRMAPWWAKVAHQNGARSRVKVPRGRFPTRVAPMPPAGR